VAGDSLLGRGGGAGGDTLLGGRAATAAPAPLLKRGRGSLLGKIGGLAKSAVAGFPRGLVALGKDVGKTVAEGVSHDVHHPVAALKGLVGLAPPGPTVRTRLGETEAQAYARQHPALAGVAEGFKQTGNEIAHPSRILQNYGSAPLSAFLNDAANLSVVLGPVAKAAGAGAAVGEGAQAGRLARGLGAAAKVTQEAAMLPAKPFELAGRGVSAVARTAYTKTAESGGVAGDTLRLLRLDPESRLLRREALTPAMEQQSEVVGRQVSLGRNLEKLLPDSTEQQAYFLVGEGQADALAKLRAAAPERFTSFVDDTFRGSVSTEAAHLAADVAEGHGGPISERIQAALALGREAPGGRTERLAQYLRGPASRQEQVGFAPLSASVQAAVEKAGRGLPRAERVASAARARAEEASTRLANLRADLSAAAEARGGPTYGMGKRLGQAETRARVLENVAKSAEVRSSALRTRVERAQANAEHAVGNAPARLRPALELHRRVVRELTAHENSLRRRWLPDAAAAVGRVADEVPVTLRALQDAGVDPEHFIHVQTGDKPLAAGASGDRLPKVRKARSEKYRSDSLVHERTIRAQTQGEIDEARAVIGKLAAEKVAAMPFAARLNEGPLAGVATEAEATAAGYVPWNPRTIFEKGQVTQAETRAAAAGETGATVFVPRHIFDGFRSYFESNRWDKFFRQTYDPAVQGFKAGVLALSPSWQVNNVLGNIVLATLGAGVDPITLARNIGAALKEYKASGDKGERDFSAPRRLLTAGPTHSEFTFLSPPAERPLAGTAVGRVAGKITAPVKALARKSYAANEFIDNLGRAAVYMAKRGQGLSDELALRESLKAMGDFSRMTPLERRVIRRVIPFYAWQRHITQLAFRLPVEHPLRVAWTMHLGDALGAPDMDLADLPEFLRSSIDLPGGKLLQTSRLFPFGDAGRVLDRQGVVSSLSPAIKIPAQSLTGLNLSKGRPFTRPPGTGRHDEFGNPLPSAPPVARQIGDLFPQRRLLDALTGRDKTVRYDTGQPILTASGPLRADRSKGEGLLRFLGVPVLDRASAVETARRIQAKQRSEAKARAAYDRRARLRRAG
jgi:hypothetical protein